MKLRTVTYQDGRCEIVQVLDDHQLRDWSSKDPLAFEASIMWLYPLEKIPYVRVMTVRNCKSRRGRLSTGNAGRVLGYSRLTSDAPFNGEAGGFIRRVFYVREEDLRNNRIVTDAIPTTALAPSSLAPGIAGESAQSKHQTQLVSTSSTPKSRTSAFEDDVSEWIDNDSSAAVDGPLQDDATDTDIHNDIDGTLLDKAATSLNADELGSLIPVAGRPPIPLPRQDIHVGCADDCDVVLDHPDVSGLHCELTYEDGVWHVRDIGSTHGTRVDSELLPIGERRQLHHGALLTVASLEFRLEA